MFNNCIRQKHIKAQGTTLKPDCHLPEKLFFCFNESPLEKNIIIVFFFKNHAENETGRLISDLFVKKALYEVKTSRLHHSFNIFG